MRHNHATQNNPSMEMDTLVYFWERSKNRRQKRLDKKRRVCVFSANHPKKSKPKASSYGIKTEFGKKLAAAFRNYTENTKGVEHDGKR